VPQKGKNMNKAVSVTVDVGGKSITIESGLLALQAAGSTTVRLGETVVFSAVTAGSKPKEGMDHFPLQVEYREKYYAAGRFPGGFMKRESRPSEKEILTTRLTDRPIRPLFPETYRNEVQVNNMLLSYDDANDSDILSITAASAALVISELPFLGPIAAVRVGRVNGSIVINPTHEERAQSDFNLVFASTRQHLLMIEGSAHEVSEADLVAAMKTAHKETIKLIDAQIELRKKLGLPDKIVADTPRDTTMLNAARTAGGTDLSEAVLTHGKLDRHQKVDAAMEKIKAALLAKFPEMTDEQFADTFDQLKIEVVRDNVLSRGKRMDGRGYEDIRPLVAQVGLLPRTHGSSLFSRGETQALASVTLGAKGDAQQLDAIAGGPDEKSFMLHYNFPPYSVGEVGRLGATGRREIGHGNLAERSLKQMMPADYPYTVRVVSDIMGSNGSSSMASVCAGCLALLDAGVPMRKPVAGISIGLFTGNNKAILVTDIIGDEDHCGDMDFKVSGTRDGVTGFQVDLKLRGLEWSLVEGAFEKARTARLKILDFMSTVIPAPRDTVSKYAPRIQVIMIDPEKIGDLIGPGGKNIRRITELTGTQIDIDDSGKVSIFAKSAQTMELAVKEVNAVTAEIVEGEIYDGKVVKIMPFGAFVQVLPGQDGLVHISELADFRVNTVEDVCKVGDQMWVKCIGVDDRGRVRLSRKEAMKQKQAK